MIPRDLLNKYFVNWSASVSNIASSNWEEIFGKSLIKSQQFFLSMEKSCFPQIRFNYLQIFQHETIVAIVPCFCYEIDVLDLITSSTAKAITKGVRMLYGNFFKIRAFVTGTYAASCEHFIEYRSTLSIEERCIVSDFINKQLKYKCKETKSKFIFIKDVRERYITSIQGTLERDFHFFPSFPTTVIPVLNDYKYPELLKSKYRKRFRDYKKAFDESFTWEMLTDFSSQVSLFTELYNNVLGKAENKFEFLNAAFFKNINTLFASNSFFLIAKDKVGEVRLMILILEDTECLIPLYMGVRYKTDDARVLYIAALGRMVKEAENRHKDYVDLGQTSYYPKVMSGAFAENIYYGFWSSHYLLKWAIRNVFSKIFIPHYIPENIYLESHKQDVYSVLERKGFVLLNK